jgi:hypothetical protein
MVYRVVDMWEILKVLRWLQREEPGAAIERATGRARKQSVALQADSVVQRAEDRHRRHGRAVRVDHDSCRN